MPPSDLHGNVPDNCAVALLLIDVINDLEFPGGPELARFALPMATKLAALRERARRQGIPVIYVNDNFGKWRSDFMGTVSHCLEEGVRGKPICQALRPADDDYFVLKPKHSGFFSTTLEILLRYLGAKTLILTGLAADNCVLFTANDAYLRDFEIAVPSDCVASETAERTSTALSQMERLLKAQIGPADELDLGEMMARSAKAQ